MAKKVRSVKNFWGETVHYDEHGKKIGVSRSNFGVEQVTMMLTAARLASQVRTSGEAKRSGIPTAKRLVNLITISGVSLSIVMPPARESAEQESHSGGKRKRNLMIVTDCALHVVWTRSCWPSKRFVSATFEEIAAEQCKPKASCSSILQDVFYSTCFCGIYSAQHASMMLSVIRA